MKKTVLLLSVCLMLILGCGFVSFTSAVAERAAFSVAVKEEGGIPETDAVIALLLYPHIDEAIQNYYGEPTQFALYDAEVTDITQTGNSFAYQVTVAVPTFHGAHNPPYGLEVLTFAVEAGQVSLINYEQRNTD